VNVRGTITVAVLVAAVAAACGSPPAPAPAIANVPRVAACARATADCDGVAANGCETDTATSRSHCGSCGHACEIDERCDAGACRLAGRRIAKGGGRTCVIRPSGKLACWGNVLFGSEPARPALVEGIDDARSVALGNGVTYVLREGGQVVAWGRNFDGECDASTTQEVRSPSPIAGVGDAIDVGGGNGFACAVRASGRLACWGHSDIFFLDDAIKSGRSAPHDVFGIEDAAQVAVGSNHMCITRRDGTVACWGNSREGAIGDGKHEVQRRPAATVGIDGVTRVTAARSTCALGTTGKVWCWGWNGSGELGDGTTESRLVPTPVRAIDDARYLESNGWTDGGCVVRRSGEVWCWGLVADPISWAHPALAKPKRLEPAPIDGVGDALEVATTRWSACALRRSGRIACWGDRVAIGADTTGLVQDAPKPVAGLDDAIEIASSMTHACAVRRGGQVVCWGANDHRKLGDGTTEARGTPVAAGGVTDAIHVSAGPRHTCAVRRGGQIVCWGRNATGELGDGTREERAAPVAVKGIADAELVVAGSNATCAARKSGGVVCWGDLEQLGADDDARPLLAPAPVRGVDRAARLFADQTDLFDFVQARFCAVTRAGAYACWGRYAKPNALTARAMTGLADARAGVVHGDYGCVVRATGAYSCSLPIRDQLEARAAKSVHPLEDPTRIGDAIDVSDGCVLRASGAVWCRAGSTLRLVDGIDDGIAIAGGSGFTCALRKTGKVACWGSNEDGRLGNGVVASSVAPAPIDVPLP
jgi:alpha-tubulin suppressor-like RCC1 family protein